MDFSLTPEQLALQAKAREFAMEELLPYYTRWDREQTYPAELVKKWARLV